MSTDIAGNSDYARVLVQQADGKLVAAGRTDTLTGTDFGLAATTPTAPWTQASGPAAR